MVNINDVIFLYHESKKSAYEYLSKNISELYSNMLKHVSINFTENTFTYMRALIYLNYSEFGIECYEIIDMLYDENYNEEKLKKIVSIYNEMSRSYLENRKIDLDTLNELRKFASIRKYEYGSEFIFAKICELLNEKFNINSYNIVDILKCIEKNMSYFYEGVHQYINGQFSNDVEKFNYIFELYNSILLDLSENKIDLLINNNKIYEAVREYQELVEEKLKNKKEYVKKNDWYEMIKLFEKKYEEVKDILNVDEETELYYIIKLYEKLKKEQ